MKTISCLAATLLLAGLAIPHQAGAQTPYGLKAQVEQSQARVDDLAGQIDALDNDIEKKVDDIVTQLSAVRDSTGTSRTGTSKGTPTRRPPLVVDAKIQAMEGLLANLQEYERERLTLQDQLRMTAGRGDNESLEQEMEFLDGRIEKRIDQIVTLAASLTRHKDLQKFQYRQRPGTKAVKKTTDPNYKLNQRVSAAAEPVRLKVAEKLDQRIKELQRSEALLKSRIAAASDDDQRKALEAPLGEAQEELTKRQGQLAEISSAAQPETTEVGLAEVANIERGVYRDVQDIRSTFNQLTRLKSEVNLERDRLRSLQMRMQISGGN